MTLDKLIGHVPPVLPPRKEQQNSSETFAGIGVVSAMFSMMTRIETPVADTLLLNVVRLV
jgi:hypothetical protein